MTEWIQLTDNYGKPVSIATDEIALVKPSVDPNSPTELLPFTRIVIAASGSEGWLVVRESYDEVRRLLGMTNV